MSQEEFQEQSIEDAVAQATDFVGLARPKVVKGKTRTWTIPNPSLLSPEQEKRVNQMKIDLDKTLDRYPDVVDDDGKVLRRGLIKDPYQIDGELCDSYEEFLMKAIFDDEYEAAVQDGLYPSYFGLFWTEMNKRLAEAQASDSKSA